LAKGSNPSLAIFFNTPHIWCKTSKTSVDETEVSIEVKSEVEAETPTAQPTDAEVNW